MKVLAVVTAKGGAGKSTLSQVLSVALDGVVLVDMDPQLDSAEWAETRRESFPDLPSVAFAQATTAAEIERIRQAFRAVRLCATAAERPAFSDGPMVQIEFANETRYCFASRAPQREGEPEFGAFLDLVRGLAGVEWPG